MKGIIKPGNSLTKEGEIVGEIKELQHQGENVGEAKAGERVAVSIDGATVGKNIDEGDELDVALGKRDISVLNKSGGWATVQLPAGMDLDWAAAELEKEYNIASAEKINVLHTPLVRYDVPVAKGSSFLPFDPMYGY